LLLHDAERSVPSSAVRASLSKNLESSRKRFSEGGAQNRQEKIAEKMRNIKAQAFQQKDMVQT
jgi:hypothetical protein